MNNDFVDLRRQHLSSESFWPSFTDIMMVVVIIFLLTSMILMVRNWELLDQLRTSMAAEEEAAKIIDDTSAENATLEEQLAQAQNEISLLRMQLLQDAEIQSELKSRLDEKEQAIILVQDDNRQLQKHLNDRQSDIVILNNRLDTMQATLDQLHLDIENKDQALQAARSRIVVLTQNSQNEARKLSDLLEEYDILKVKYDKLVRPARTARGKHVVSVNYERIDGKPRIRIKDAGEAQYTTVSNSQLHQRLTALKKRHPGKLYIKIVIPKESGLTYSEAWTFMKDLLDKYDYYSDTP